MAGLGLSGGYGAAGAGNALADIIKQKLAELQVQQAETARKEKMAQDESQFSRSLAQQQAALAESAAERKSRDAYQQNTTEGAAFDRDLTNAGADANVTALVNAQRPENPITQRAALALRTVKQPDVVSMKPGQENYLPGTTQFRTAPRPPANVTPESMQRVDDALVDGKVVGALNFHPREGQGFYTYASGPQAGQKVSGVVTKVAPQQGQANEIDRSYKLHLDKIDILKKPLQDRAERLTRLADTLNAGTPVADSVVAPELITAMAGGLGSGVRITNAEIQSVVGGRNHWQDLAAALDKWNLDPNHAFAFTPEQRQQMRALTNYVAGRVNTALDRLDEAGTALSTATSVQEHRNIYNGLKLKLSDYARGVGGSDKTVTSQELVIIAKNNGTTVEQEKARYAAAGYTIK